MYCFLSQIWSIYFLCNNHKALLQENAQAAHKSTVTLANSARPRCFEQEHTLSSLCSNELPRFAFHYCSAVVASDRAESERERKLDYCRHQLM